MTVVVAFNCTDGVVIAADSMLTTGMGGINVAHHHGQKLSILPGPQIFALVGDQGQNDRFRIFAEMHHGAAATQPHAIMYPLFLTQNIMQQFISTGINNIGAAPVLAYAHSGQHYCCTFEALLQPRLLDEHHYYVASGSGKLSADPFLRFLVDVFCHNGQPTVREAIFLATWVVQHVITVNPGGVAGPIRLATFVKDAQGYYEAKSLPVEEIEEHQQAIESAADALRAWRDKLQSGAAAGDAPQQPELPQS